MRKAVDHFAEPGYTQFLQKLIDEGHIASTPLALTKLVIQNGIGCLSDRSLWLFQVEVEDEFVTEKCRKCHAIIPWHDMYFAYDSGGLCVACDRKKAR